MGFTRQLLMVVIQLLSTLEDWKTAPFQTASPTQASSAESANSAF
jgi:hypothetical protein